MLIWGVFYDGHLAEEECEYFAFLTRDGLTTPTRVSQRFVNATLYFQDDLVGGVCLIIGGLMQDLIVNLRALLLWFMELGLFLGVDKFVLFARKIKWCRKLYSGTPVKQDPVRALKLEEMRRWETFSALMQFLPATNWMRLSLLQMAEIVAPLRTLMESGGKSRTERNTWRFRWL